MAQVLNKFPAIPSHVLVIADPERPWMMHGQRGMRVRLNAQALALIRACNGKHTVAEITQIEADRSGLPAERVQGNVMSLLEGLESKGLLELSAERCQFSLETVSLELTNQCNLHCRHCVYGHRVDQALRDRLPLPLIERVVTEMAEMGGREIFLTGGEPSLHPDFLEIAQMGKAHGLRVIIQTNGVHLTDTMIERLHTMGVDKVIISLDGVTPETNDAIRGSGTFVRATATLRQLQAASVPVAICFTACKINQPEWTRLGELCEMFKLDTIQSSEVAIWGRAAEYEHELGLSAQEIHEFRRIALGLVTRGLGQRPIQARVGEDEGRGYWREMCVAGRTKCTVLHNGDLLTCSMCDQPELVVGNLHRASLRDLWENAPIFQQFRELSVLQFEPCATCAYQFVCGGGCRAKAYMLHGNLRGSPCPLDCEWRRMFMAEMVVRPEFQGRSHSARAPQSQAERESELA
jgi:radical SAM protein with 4Fe4S-binding SPASM domain